jgi:hypothetical protein
MRARDRDGPAGAGARYGVERGVVGIGGALGGPPATLDEALAAVRAVHGEKAARMLRRFAELPAGTLVWTRTSRDAYRLGRITGRWRYEDSVAAASVGIRHVRPARWLDDPFGELDVPPAVAATFARGGRNLQRIHDEEAERLTWALWQERGCY